MNLKKSYIIVLLLLFCSCQEKSDFFSDCKCNKKNLNDGIKVTDNFNRFHVIIPNKNWNPTIITDESGNGIDAAIVEGKTIKYFGVNELEKYAGWKNLRDQLAETDSIVNAIESGLVKINGKESIWCLINDEYESIPTLTLYITTEHPVKNSFYTLNLTVSKEGNGKKNLCELENIIKSFRTN